MAFREEAPDYELIAFGDGGSRDPANAPRIPRGQPWEAGLWRRFPWLGIFALVIALAAAVVVTAVLVISNDKPIENWRIQTTVYLSIASTIANIALRFAFAEGLVIAWWYRAMGKNTKVADLHNVWAFGNEVKAALFAGRGFNRVALVSLAVSLVPINGPLLQRASVVTFRTDIQNKSITIPIAPEFPDGFTGIITCRSSQVALTTQNFASVVSDDRVGRPMTIPGSGCKDNCSGLLQGAGYAIVRQARHLTTYPRM
jgi:hypothetical protein